LAPRVDLTQLTRRPPAQRLARPGYFYPHEVVEILGLHGIDYRQIRRLFRLVRPARAAKKWARFTFRDLAAVQTAVELAGGKAALGDGRRLRFTQVERVCETLRTKYKIPEPLVDVELRREGKRIVATVGQMSLEPTTGQMRLHIEVGRSAIAHVREIRTPTEEIATLREQLRIELGVRPPRRAVGFRPPVQVAIVERSRG
jgi:hypothetical protein